ncbi:SDR family NAD(P)-dependent oxidoreductase [Streptosporangium sp. NPDC001681]|uniref:SDR family NAD(P)-dependent oxidoreductase n=1 Tax=Streptosporangium sp. NPDC001681 TaxID=3154395 RepID=UPI003329AFFF
MQDLQGRVAVVTGAGSGLGRAIALRLGREGMRVVAADLDGASAEDTAAQLADSGVEALPVAADMASVAAVEGLADAAFARFGRVHLLCNNAGVDGYRGGPIWAAAPADWERTLGINLYGVVNGVRTFLPRMLDDEDGGWLVTTGSLGGLVSAASMYGVSKHAVVAYMEAVDAALRARESSIRTLVLLPGPISTAFGERALAADASAVARSEREAIRDLVASGSDPAVIADALLEGLRSGAGYVVAGGDLDGFRERVATVEKALQVP